MSWPSFILVRMFIEEALIEPFPPLPSSHLLQKVIHCNTSDAAALAPFLIPGQNKVTMVLLESPTNPMLKIADIAAIVSIVRAGAPVRSSLLLRSRLASFSQLHENSSSIDTDTLLLVGSLQDALIVADNTMMSPYLQRPLDLGVDICYDSGTKFLSGHHDLMAGIVTARTEEVGKVSCFRSSEENEFLSNWAELLLPSCVRSDSLGSSTPWEPLSLPSTVSFSFEDVSSALLPPFLSFPSLNLSSLPFLSQNPPSPNGSTASLLQPHRHLPSHSRIQGSLPWTQSRSWTRASLQAGHRSWRSHEFRDGRRRFERGNRQWNQDLGYQCQFRSCQQSD